MASLVVPQNCIDQSIQKILFSFKRLVRDCIIMNSNFFNEFAHWHETIIPFVIENYESLPDKQKENISSMHHVFYDLHVLHNFDIYSEKTILQWEKNVEEEGSSNEELKLRIAGHMIFYLKSLGYCPIAMGIRNVENMINGQHI